MEQSLSKSASIPITFGRVTTTAASQLDTRVQSEKVNQGDVSQNGQEPVNLDRQHRIEIN